MPDIRDLCIIEYMSLIRHDNFPEESPDDRKNSTCGVSDAGTMAYPVSVPMLMSHRIELLQRPSCLLCLEAEFVLMQAGVVDFERVDIERDATLEERYGHLIPVLRSRDGGELAWPFSIDSLHAWLGGSSQSRSA